MATGYEPFDLPKPVADDIWVVDGPPIRFWQMPFPTRMVVVRLADGSLWVHSPIRMSAPLAARIDGLGPVRCLVAPNWIHYAYVAQWQVRYPQARCWAAPGVEARARRKGVAGRWDAELGQQAPAEWAGQIDQMVVRGSRIHREAVFFHRASRTLILTDLIENFDPVHLPWWMRILTRVIGVQDPDGKMPRDMQATFRAGRDELRIDVEKMIAWNPERLILAHGRWYATGAVEELQRAFRWVL